MKVGITILIATNLPEPLVEITRHLAGTGRKRRPGSDPMPKVTPCLNLFILHVTRCTL